MSPELLADIEARLQALQEVDFRPVTARQPGLADKMDVMLWGDVPALLDEVRRLQPPPVLAAVAGGGCGR